MVHVGADELYWEAEGSGPALMMTHGLGSSSEVWDGQVEALRGNWRCVRWDMRGHGRSDYPDDQASYTREQVVEDLDAVRRAAAAQTMVLLGHSLGGYISLAYWATYPERVSALVLFGTGPGFRSEASRQRWNDYAAAWAARVESEGLEGLHRARQDAGGVITHRSVAGIIRMARGPFVHRDSKVIDVVNRISVPTLVIVGAEDSLRSGTDYLAQRIPGARCAVIDGAGHPANLQRPQEFNDALRDFLDSLPGSGLATG